MLSLNIVLASIDHFPTAWSYISSPKLSATRGWLLGRKQNAVVRLDLNDESEVAEKVKQIFEANGLKTQISRDSTTEYAVDADGKKNFFETISKTNTFVFGESGRFNRIGPYIVHVCLLTLFIGHFVALQTGFDADVRMIPGDATDKIQLIQFNLDRKENSTSSFPLR